MHEKLKLEKTLKRVGFRKPSCLRLSSNWEGSFLSIKSDRNPAPLSNTIPGYGYRNDIDDYKWKRNSKESTETILEIEAKRKRIAPQWNKGANQYITDATDLKTLGKKS